MSDLGNKEIFAKNLRYYMSINNKDRNDICNDLDFSYSTFNDWYNGNVYPRIDKIEMLANYFKIEKSDLIENRQKLDDEIEVRAIARNILKLNNDKQELIKNLIKTMSSEAGDAKNK